LSRLLRDAVFAVGTMLCAACSGVEGTRIPPAEKLPENSGIPVILPKLEAQLTRSLRNQEPVYTVKFVRKPDPEARYAIRPVPGPLADFDFDTGLDDIGALQSTKATVTDQAGPIITAIGTTALAAAGVALRFADTDADAPITGQLSRHLARPPGTCAADASQELEERVEALVAVERGRLYPDRNKDDLLASGMTFTSDPQQQCLEAIKGVAESAGQKELSALLQDVLTQSLPERRARVVLLLSDQVKVERLKLAAQGKDPATSQDLKDKVQALANAVEAPTLPSRIARIERELNAPPTPSGDSSAYEEYERKRVLAQILLESFNTAVGMALAPLKPADPRLFADEPVPIVGHACLTLADTAANPPTKPTVSRTDECIPEGELPPRFIVVMRAAGNTREGVQQ
jgi:hypothetical protein